MENVSLSMYYFTNIIYIRSQKIIIRFQNSILSISSSHGKKSQNYWFCDVCFFTLGHPLQPLKLAGWPDCPHKEHFESRCASPLQEGTLQLLHHLHISFQMGIGSGWMSTNELLHVCLVSLIYFFFHKFLQVAWRFFFRNMLQIML